MEGGNAVRKIAGSLVLTPAWAAAAAKDAVALVVRFRHPS
jgi:hypothetical protein